MNKQQILRLLIYENRKTFLLNKTYKELLPKKIILLKSLKNHLITIQKFYTSYIVNNEYILIDNNKKQQLKDYCNNTIKGYEILKDNMQTLYKDNNKDYDNDLKIINSIIEQNKDLMLKINMEIETLKGSSQYKFMLCYPSYLTNIKHLIYKVNKSIKKYKKHYHNPYNVFNDKISIYDITYFLTTNKQNNNIKTFFNHYCFYTLYHNTSNEKLNFIHNNKVILDNGLISNAFNYDYLDKILYSRTINKFENWFLTKTI